MHRSATGQRNTGGEYTPGIGVGPLGRLGLALAWLGVLAATPVHAAPTFGTTWDTSRSFGDWFDASAWSQGVPTGEAIAEIDAGAVVIGPGASIAGSNRLTVGANFRVDGRVAGLGLGGNRLVVGDQSTPLSNGLVIGGRNGATGLVSVGSGGVLLSAGTMLLGDEGRGTLSVAQGGQVWLLGAPTIVGNLRTSVGTVLITGSQSYFGPPIRSSSVTLGREGQAVVELTSQGTFGQLSGFFVDVGTEGGGATITATGGSRFLAEGMNVWGESTFSFDNSQLFANDWLLAGPARYTLANSGTVVSFDISLDPATVLDIRLGGQDNYVHGTGRLILDGTLSLSFEDGWLASAGDQWQVVRSPDLSGEFDRIDLPGLPRGLAWNTRSLVRDGTISVVRVPEPASVLMMLAGLAAVGGGLLGRRRDGASLAPRCLRSA